MTGDGGGAVATGVTFRYDGSSSVGTDRRFQQAIFYGGVSLLLLIVLLRVVLSSTAVMQPAGVWYGSFTVFHTAINSTRYQVFDIALLSSSRTRLLFSH